MICPYGHELANSMNRKTAFFMNCNAMRCIIVFIYSLSAKQSFAIHAP